LTKPSQLTTGSEWGTLEFALAGVNFFAGVNNIVIIVLTSKVLCCSKNEIRMVSSVTIFNLNVLIIVFYSNRM
jgi:hypothetical protein